MRQLSTPVNWAASDVAWPVVHARCLSPTQTFRKWRRWNGTDRRDRRGHGWAGYPTGPTGATGAPKRKPLCGGVYGPQDALDLLNSHYLIGKSEQEVAIFRIRDDGLLTFTPPEQFKLDVRKYFRSTIDAISQVDPRGEILEGEPQPAPEGHCFQANRRDQSQTSITFGADLRLNRARDGSKSGGSCGTF